MWLEDVKACLAAEIKKLKALLATLLLHQDHPFIALTIIDAKRTGSELQSLLCSIQARRGGSVSTEDTNEMSDLGTQSERAIIASVIKAVFLRRQMTGVMSAGYGYFLCPSSVVNQSCRRIAALVADDGVFTQKTVDKGKDVEQKTGDSALFKVLLSEFTITGTQDLLEGIIDEPPTYGMVVYSEQLCTTKTGPVISIPHLFRHDLTTILAAFYLNKDQIEQLKLNPKSNFYNTKITPLTSLEKAAVCNFKLDSHDKTLNDAPKKFFLSLQRLVRAITTRDLDFLTMLSMLQDAVRTNDHTYIQAAFEDFLGYWDNLNEQKKIQFSHWHFEFNRESAIPFISCINLIKAYLDLKEFSSVSWIITYIERTFLDVQEKNGNYDICYMKLELDSWSTYCKLLASQLEQAYHLCRNLLSVEPAEAIEAKPEQIKEVLTIIESKKTAGNEAFPLVMVGARSIGLAFSQLNPGQHETYLHTIFSSTANLFTLAADFQRTFKFIPDEHLATVCNLLLPFLEKYLCLNKKADDRTSNQAFLNLKNLVCELSVAQLVVVLDVIKDKLPQIISSPNRFNLLLQAVQTEQDKCVSIYNAMKDQLKPANGVEFQAVMQYLTFNTTISREFYQRCKKGDMINIFVMINKVADKTVLDNYRSFMAGLPCEDLKVEITSALYEVITCRYIPIYKALRKAQWGFWKTNLVRDLEKLDSEAEKVERVLEHASISANSRSAVAWGLACKWSDGDVNLLQDIMAKAESNLGGFVLLLRNGLFALSTSTATPVQPTAEVNQAMKAALETELTAIRPVTFVR